MWWNRFARPAGAGVHAGPVTVLAGCLLMLATVTGCTAAETLIAVTDGDNTRAPGVKTPVAELAVSDCFTERNRADAVAGPSGVATVEVVPCADNHDWEVFHVFPVEGAAFPGDDAVQVQAEITCGSQFGVFVGVDAAVSELGYSYFTPPEVAWTGLASPTVQCFVGDMAGPVGGTLAGAAR